MNKTRPFFSGFTGAAACLIATTWPASSHAQQSTATDVRPTVRPVANNLAAAPVPAEPNATPAPDAEASEKSPPTDAADDKNQLTETDIDNSNGAHFDSKTRIAVFLGNVKVTDPRFQLVCDKLTVFLNKATPAGQNPAATPTPATSGKAGKASKGSGGAETPDIGAGGGGIDHAIAEGHVIILQKKAPTKPGEEEKLSIGRGEIGTFDNKTGDMVLKGWPSLEQNGSSLIATSAGTTMTIHRDSSLDTTGPSKTKLIQRGKGGGLDLPLGPSTPTTPAGGGRHGRGNNAAGAATPATTNPASGGR